jgi:heme-degrading monooxygenase HmoA
MVDRAQIMVAFVSRRTVEHDDAYHEVAERMEQLARAQPGFVDLVSVRDPITRQGITLAYFTNEDAVRAWRDHPEHREAQRRGILDFYEDYEVTVSSVTRQYGRIARE